ncbi:ESPR-type extended signal peptide-containing protein, partial [uncultured Acinetobacter sp.]|uniref:ESPR-type extended signal peptide-containing protein n=1 Tax=uncultured Acinetobacter sp. TaxID=165433 RepID=UPI0025CF6B16
MNKIYKVIWNATLGTWVAVSELAKGKTKSSKITKIVGAATIGLMVTFSADVSAAYTAGGGSAGSTTGIAIGNTNSSGGAGNNTTQANAAEVIAIGPNVYGAGSQSTLIGNDIATSASAIQAVVIGSNYNSTRVTTTTTTGKGGISIGSGLIDPDTLPSNVTAPKSPMANGIGSVAIGSSGDGTTNSNSLNGAVATGNHALALMAGANANALNSIAIGVASNALANSATAIGQGATVGANGVSAIAFGQSATVSSANGVALGTRATVGANGSQGVAIGSGAIVNADQSTAIGNDVVANGESSVAIGGDDLDRIAGTAAATTYNTLTGDSILSGSYPTTTANVAAVAVGVQAQALGDLSTAFGTRTKATGSASVALGVGANASLDNSVALGAGTTTASNATVVNSATVNGVAYSGFAGGSAVVAGDQVSVGKAGFERQIKNVAPGAVTATSTDAINGSQLFSVANQVGQGLNFRANAGASDKLNLGETLTLANGTNTTAVYDATTNTYKYNADSSSVTTSATSGLTVTKGAKDVNNNTAYDVALSKTTTDDIAKGVAAKTAVDSTGLTFQGDDSNIKSGVKKLGDTVSITGDSNIKTAATTGGVQVTLAKDLTIDSVTAGNSKLNTSGLTITNTTDATKTVSVTSTGINAGNQQITNVASGGTTTTNAANIGDVNTAITGLTNTGFKVGANTNPAGGAVTHKLGNQLDIVAGTKTTGNY